MSEPLPPVEPPSSSSSRPATGMPQWARVVIGILAIIGGLTVLLAAACFGILLTQ